MDSDIPAQNVKFKCIQLPLQIEENVTSSLSARLISVSKQRSSYNFSLTEKGRRLDEPLHNACSSKFLEDFSSRLGSHVKGVFSPFLEAFHEIRFSLSRTASNAAKDACSALHNSTKVSRKIRHSSQSGLNNLLLCSISSSSIAGGEGSDGSSDIGGQLDEENSNGQSGGEEMDSGNVSERDDGLPSPTAVSPSSKTNTRKPRGRKKGHAIKLPDDPEGQERVLISEILIKDMDGQDVEDKSLLGIAMKAVKASKPTLALTTKEVQEDVFRIIDTGYFASCLPLAEDTRDGVRLIFRVEPNVEMMGLKVYGANVLPSRIVEDAFREDFGKVINIHSLNRAMDTVNGWYNTRGLFGQVTDMAMLPGGVICIQVAESEVNTITIRFRDRKTGEPTTGKTRPETLLRQLMTKPGQVYSLQQGKRDVETVFTMGIMEDVNVVPQPADTGMVDLTMNVVERVAGGFSAGGGLSGNSISNGALSGLIGRPVSTALLHSGLGALFKAIEPFTYPVMYFYEFFAYSHRNAFGRNQKLNISLERGQFDSMFKINYTDPWIEGDDKRTSRAINIQNSRSPGTTVHGVRREGAGPWHGGITIGRLVGGVDWSRPLRPKWSGTAGLSFQRAGARDDHGQPRLVDTYGSPLTFSGRTCDNMLVGKLETVYTDSGDNGSSQLVLNTEQGLPIQPDWLFFNRINVRARQGVRLGPLRCIGSFSGGTVVGDLAPHEAFPIGGANSVRGYDEGAVGSGRSYVVTSGEISVPLVGPIEGAVFADYGTDLGSGATVLGDPAGARGKPGTGYGYGAGIRFDSPLGPLRLEYAFNDKGIRRFHFGIGYRN